MSSCNSTYTEYQLYMKLLHPLSLSCSNDRNPIRSYLASRKGKERSGGSRRSKNIMTTSEERKSKAVLHEKLLQLRSLTNSSAMNKASLLIDASKYIQDLKKKVDECTEELAARGSSSMVEVETLDKGSFSVSVFCDNNCPGLLVSVLEAFEELGLDVMDATISCDHSFRLEAVGGEPRDESLDAEMVRQAVVQAIHKCTGKMRKLTSKLI